MKFYLSIYGEKDFYVDEEEVINDTLKNVPLSVRIETLFSDEINITKEKIYEMIFHQDIFEIAKEVEYYAGWIDEIVIENAITEYDTDFMEEIYCLYDGKKDETDSLRKIEDYAFAFETVNDYWEIIKDGGVSHTSYKHLDIYISQMNDYKISVEINDGEKVVNAAICEMRKKHVIEAICCMIG